MITMEQIHKLRNLHDVEKACYIETFNNNSISLYERWVKACNELNNFIQTIAVEE